MAMNMRRQVIERFLKGKALQEFLANYESHKFKDSGKKIDLEVAKKVLKALRSGKPIADIAQDFGFKTKTTVYHHAAVAAMDEK